MEDPGLFRTLYTTRALRRFRPDPVPDEVLFQVLDAAIRAPSGQNAQDWRFVVVTDPQAKRTMASWAEEAWTAYEERWGGAEAIAALPRSQRLSLDSVRDLARGFAEVPVVIVVSGLRGRHGTPGGSIFPAVQNLLLAAHGLGLAASIFNLALRPPELGQLLGVPDSNEIHCVIPLGHPLDRFGPVRRKPVRDVVFAERFGERWPFAQDQPEDGWTGRWDR